ncbi:MAG: glycerol-3-phosphate acyltransferase [Oscillospiraceae bacterium]|nr:glycerol-3-phosphate acyltransferase [Candidatus Equicaccousia limihippi]
MLVYIVFAVVGFLSGSVLYCYGLPLIFKKTDVRKDRYDRNPGGYNAIQATGPLFGGVCLALDVLKGFLPVLFARKMGADTSNILFILVLVAPVLGHILGIFVKDGGGKGIAVSFGVLLALIPTDFCVLVLGVFYAFCTWIVEVFPNSKRSIICFGSTSAISFASSFFTGHFVISVALLIISILVTLKHFESDDIHISQRLENIFKAHRN